MPVLRRDLIRRVPSFSGRPQLGSVQCCFSPSEVDGLSIVSDREERDGSRIDEFLPGAGSWKA